MSESHSPIFSTNQRLEGNHAMQPTPSEPRPAFHTADSAIDGALRTVPLPDGMLTRLSRIIRNMPDDAPDQVDWLRC